MKRRAYGLALSLLLMMNLTACGGEPDAISSTGIHNVVPEASNDAIVSVIPPVDLPVAEPEDNSTADTSQKNGNTPDSNQDPDSSQRTDEGNRPDGKSSEGNKTLSEDGWYTSKDEVALYIHLYERLPDNYVTKNEAEDAGWHGGNVERYTGEGTAIGGSRFSNREGLLPKEQGRTYTECDIDTPGENSRGAKRIVFSNDGLVYYTDDHYESFELLYGAP